MYLCMPNSQEGTNNFEFVVEKFRKVSLVSLHSTTLKIEHFVKGVWGYCSSLTLRWTSLRVKELVLLCLTPVENAVVMMRHASVQVNHRRLKELQQVIQPHTHTHTHGYSLTKVCTADHLCPAQSQYNHKAPIRRMKLGWCVFLCLELNPRWFRRLWRYPQYSERD